MKSFVLAAALSALALATGSQLIGAQSIQSRPAAEVRLSADPLLSVGMLDGPGEYLFGDINAGSLLADGGVVVSDRMNFRIQRFGPDGEHLWSRGREGEGPGEFENVQIVHGCVSADRIVVYDIWNPRVSVFNDEGDLVDDYRLLYNGLPIRRFACAPNGRLGFTGDSDQTIEGLASEELYRQLMTLGWVELGDTAATTVRQRIPGSERRYLGRGRRHARKHLGAQRSDCCGHRGHLAWKQRGLRGGTDWVDGRDDSADPLAGAGSERDPEGCRPIP